MNMPSKKTLCISGIVAAVLFVVAALGLWMTSPTRTYNAFMDAVVAKDSAKALSYVSSDVAQNKRENIEFFLEDWTTADAVTAAEDKNEAWRTRDEDGKKITVPTQHLLAHNYHVYTTVTFDEFEDPVIVVLRRKTENTSSILGQVFRGWEVVQIKYQPFDEEDLADIEAELDFGTEEDDATTDAENTDAENEEIGVVDGPDTTEPIGEVDGDTSTNTQITTE